MTILNSQDCLLLIIDIQEKLLNAVFNKDELEKKANILLKSVDILNLPVFITEQYPQGLGETISSLKGVAKNANYYIKQDFNALSDVNILNDIQKTGKKQVLVVGIETHICVYQTVCSLLEQGFDVTVIKDSCGSREEKEYLSALECMKNTGAQIKTTEMVLFELLKTAKHPKFKEIQSLIK